MFGGRDRRIRDYCAALSSPVFAVSGGSVGGPAACAGRGSGYISYRLHQAAQMGTARQIFRLAVHGFRQFSARPVAQSEAVRRTLAASDRPLSTGTTDRRTAGTRRGATGHRLDQAGLANTLENATGVHLATGYRESGNAGNCQTTGYPGGNSPGTFNAGTTKVA